MLIKTPLMGPDGIGITTKAAIGTTAPCIDKYQLVDIAIVIPVVKTPVDVTCQQNIEGIIHQVLGVLILTLSAAVFLTGINLDILQIEHHIELAITLLIEIVVYGTMERIFREILVIEDLIPLLNGGGLITLKLTVLE